MTLTSKAPAGAPTSCLAPSWIRTKMNSALLFLMNPLKKVREKGRWTGAKARGTGRFWSWRE